MGSCFTCLSNKIPDIQLDASGNTTRCRSVCCHKHQISVVVSNEKDKKYILEILELSKSNIINKSYSIPNFTDKDKTKDDNESKDETKENNVIV